MKLFRLPPLTNWDGSLAGEDSLVGFPICQELVKYGAVEGETVRLVKRRSSC